ncbi:hypothetical protein ACJMK2_018739 [Sinanodonta woodiana]|uniref:Mab-21-like HhH/H2TH-like domain-containing protein n=1 Tax=Sinanodonta woodiana TaxID=1069815 RepID=A0ABD3UI94_SINWO
MTDQVPGHYCSVSERLSNILNHVGYSRKDRFRKVTVVNETGVEGSTGPGLKSDTDRMFQVNTIKVVTEISQCQPEMNNMLMVHDDHTHSGSYIDDLTTIDLLYRTVLRNTLHHNIGTVSGPACHYQNNLPELSTDVVYAYRCSQWPQEGNEWFLRRRLHGWPTPIQIENAREYGCFVTAVGHPHSSECHLEWRLSFSITERELTISFVDTTMKVYILLKMIRKTYIEPVIGDAFSSYHCKVYMFWMRERIQHELWIKRNLLYCLVLCLRQLYEWATTGFCPENFIVTHNIYDRNIIGTVRNNLVKILRSLLSSNCTFLLGIE